jgi:cell division GTPase FtsZ
MVEENDKRGIRAGPVFERISSPEDAARYNYQQKPVVVGQPSVGPSETLPLPHQPQVQPKPKVEEKLETPVPEKPKPQMRIPELDQAMLEAARTGLRETAKVVAEERYVGKPEERKVENTPEKKEEVVDTLQKALLNPKVKGMRWGIIGAGHAGGRLAEQFHKFGYSICAINTAKQDLSMLDLPEENKLLLDYALGGAGKDMAIGEAAVTEYENEIFTLMRKVFDQAVDTILVCIGGGGGTGSGGAVKLINMVTKFGLPVVVLYTLPLSSEGSLTKANAIRALDKIARMSADGKVNALIIVDNAKIEQLYPNIAMAQFWKVANFDIVNSLNMFNTLCRCDTKFDALDPMDFLRIFSTGNCTIFGRIEIPIEIRDGHVVMYEDELARQVIDNLQGGLLADGFNLKETVSGGIIITGPENILDQIPAVNVNFMYHQLNNLVGDANIYRGLYRDDNPRPRLTIYTILSGLGLPVQRVDNLLREAQQAMSAIESKVADKGKMVVDTQRPVAENDKNIYEDMKNRSTPFGRLSQIRGKRRGVGRG